MAPEQAAGQTGPDAFGILGPLEVSRSGRAVPLGGPRQRAVLALLLLEANRVVSMDRLAGDGWGGRPPGGGGTPRPTDPIRPPPRPRPARAPRGAGGLRAA